MDRRHEKISALFADVSQLRDLINRSAGYKRTTKKKAAPIIPFWCKVVRKRL